MDAQQLFWATGINNTALDTDAKAAVQIFSRLQKDVKAELEKIEKAYEATRMKTNLKFTNPVDPSMVESIKSQMRELGKVIDEQTKAVAGLSLSYDKAMQNINKSASKVSSSVAWKASTSSCGKWRTKPTVSTSTTLPTPDHDTLRSVGSSVANS